MRSNELERQLSDDGRAESSGGPVAMIPLLLGQKRTEPARRLRPEVFIYETQAPRGRQDSEQGVPAPLHRPMAGPLPVACATGEERGLRNLRKRSRQKKRRHCCRRECPWRRGRRVRRRVLRLMGGGGTRGSARARRFRWLLRASALRSGGAHWTCRLRSAYRATAWSRSGLRTGPR
jgi:hypothetical protein